MQQRLELTNLQLELLPLQRHKIMSASFSSPHMALSKLYAGTIAESIILWEPRTSDVTSDPRTMPTPA